MLKKLNYLKSKRFFTLFAFVTVLNICLGAFLLTVTFSQNSKPDLSLQKTIDAYVIDQKDSPIEITIVEIENSNPLRQIIVYNLRNVSDKSIRAYTLLGSGKSNGKTITGSFTTELFESDQHKLDDFSVEREITKDGHQIALSIDYVEFFDGTVWGSDSAGKSKQIAAGREGHKFAIKQFKKLIGEQTANSESELNRLLERNIQEINVEVPFENQSDEWKASFLRGYRTVVSVLKRTQQQTETLAQKLEKMEKIAQ